MKASKMLISTLKEAPKEAQIDSHILLLRAGMIRNDVSGVYNYLPTGLRSLKKVENIIREEMDKIGGQEILCSAIQPKELWEESGRWSKYGPELMRFTDRHEREFALGPTHEEIFTDIARNLIKSQKMLPMNLYQIQTKYRDELRPRFGLMRSREFIMKDSYSFDKDSEGLEASYKEMYETYERIFTRLNLKFKAVIADSGNIGGNGSHQFMALSNIGESDIAYCDSCGYAADVEAASAISNLDENDVLPLKIEKVSTPNVKTMTELEDFLNIDLAHTVKSVMYKNNETKELALVLVRGDREVNDVKVQNALNTSEVFLTLASDKDILDSGTIPGFIGPVNLKNVRLLVDTEVTKMKNFVTGANEKDTHYINTNYGSDFTGEIFDLRKTVAGDLCPVCGKPLKIDRGIEVGQVFKLQTKYSIPMKCTYQDEKGKNVPMYMGCYGIGVTRTLQAIVEQYHDEHGIVWPLNTAPYHAVIMPINKNIEEQINLATKGYNDLLNSHVEIVLDDRKAKAGFKFKDWDLIGIPYLIVCGKKSSEGIVELKKRSTNEKVEMKLNEALEIIKNEVLNIK